MLAFTGSTYSGNDGIFVQFVSKCEHRMSAISYRRLCTLVPHSPRRCHQSPFSSKATTHCAQRLCAVSCDPIAQPVFFPVLVLPVLEPDTCRRTRSRSSKSPQTRNGPHNWRFWVALLGMSLKRLSRRNHCRSRCLLWKTPSWGVTSWKCFARGVPKILMCSETLHACKRAFGLRSDLE